MELDCGCRLDQETMTTENINKKELKEILKELKKEILDEVDFLINKRLGKFETREGLFEIMTNQNESAEKPLNSYEVIKKFCNECGNPLVTDEQKSTLTRANCKLNVIAKHVTDRSLRKLDHDGKTGEHEAK